MLDNIKMVFFDFDNTLAIHAADYFSGMSEEDYYTLAIKGADLYKNSSAPLEFRVLVHYWLLSDRYVACMTHEVCNLTVPIKQRFCDENYFGIPVFTSPSPTEKSVIAKYFCRAHDVQPHEVLIIDDAHSVLQAAYESGFNVATPQYVLTHFGDFAPSAVLVGDNIDRDMASRYLTMI